MEGSNNLFFGAGPAPRNSHITKSVSADPKFVNPSQSDFHLQASSPARGNGINASLVADHDGVVRGAAEGYVIGAYNYAPE